MRYEVHQITAYEVYQKTAYEVYQITAYEVHQIADNVLYSNRSDCHSKPTAHPRCLHSELLHVWSPSIHRWLSLT